MWARTCFPYIASWVSPQQRFLLLLKMNYVVSNINRWITVWITIQVEDWVIIVLLATVFSVYIHHRQDYNAWLSLFHNKDGGFQFQIVNFQNFWQQSYFQLKWIANKDKASQELWFKQTFSRPYLLFKGKATTSLFMTTLFFVCSVHWSYFLSELLKFNGITCSFQNFKLPSIAKQKFIT